MVIDATKTGTEIITTLKDTVMKNADITLHHNAVSRNCKWSTDAILIYYSLILIFWMFAWSKK